MFHSEFINLKIQFIKGNLFSLSEFIKKKE